MLTKPFQVSLQATIVAGFAAAIIFTAVVVHAAWSYASKQNLAELSERLSGQVAIYLADKIDGLLDDAVIARQAFAATVHAQTAGDRAQSVDERLILSFFHSHPKLDEMEFSLPDDHSIRVAALDSGEVVTEEVLPSAGALRLTRKFYRPSDRGELVLKQEDIDHSDYFATRQFWYRMAFVDDRSEWSNIYPAARAVGFRVTTSEIVDATDPLSGFVGVTLSLDRLSSFLNEIKLTPGSVIFLTNTASQILAAQSNALTSPVPPRSEPRIAKLEEVDFLAADIVSRVIARGGVNLRELKQSYFAVFSDRPSGDTHFVMLAPLSQMGLIAAVVIPEGDLLGNINTNLQFLLFVVAALVMSVVLITAVIARRYLGRPLSAVVQNLQYLENFEHENIVTKTSPFVEVSAVSHAIIRMNHSLTSFGRYIPKKLVQSLFEQGVEAKLGAEQRTMTTLFVDLANFTHISEALGDDVAEFLGDYLSAISEVVQRHGGTIDKYIGDSVMAFWGAPEAHSSHALSACRAALSCCEAISALRDSTRARGLPDVYARIGVNSGAALVGNFGSPDRLNYTAIGDSVNIAARLESLNKVYGSEILIGESTYALVCHDVVARLVDRVSVYGKDDAIDVYELLTLRDSEGPAAPQWVQLYEKGLSLMKRCEWEAAIYAFSQVINARGEDRPSAIQIERAKRYALTPPQGGWDGRIVMNAK
jgi:adenylate cyclase